MKVTLEIDEKIMQRLREVAERRGTTVSALAEAGIFQILSEERERIKSHDPLPMLPQWRGGRELVDISDREELYRIMDEYDGFRY